MKLGYGIRAGLMVACGLSLTVLRSWGAVGVPYADGFESYATGAIPVGAAWSVTGVATAQVQTATVLSGTKSCQVSNEACLTLNVSDAGATNVWCQMYVRVVAYDDAQSPPAVPADGTVAFYVNTGGVLRAYANLGTGNAWTNLATGVPTNRWLGVAVHLDYGIGNWDLYLATDGAFGSAMTKRNAGVMGFYSAASSMERVTVTNETFVDEVAVSRAFQPVAAASTPTYVKNRSFVAGGTNYFALRAYNYGSSEDTLAARLGDDLKSGLTQNDQVWIFYTNGWERFRFNSGVWESLTAPPAVADLHVSAPWGMIMARAGETNGVVFFAYNAVSNVADEIIYGTNTAISQKNGWNLYAWPFATARSVNQSAGGIGFTEAKSGDMIYVYDGNNQLAKRLNFSTNYPGGVGQWREGRVVSSYAVTEGQVFWYYSTLTGTSTWHVGQFDD